MLKQKVEKTEKGVVRWGEIEEGKWQFDITHIGDFPLCGTETTSKDAESKIRFKIRNLHTILKNDVRFEQSFGTMEYYKRSS